MITNPVLIDSHGGEVSKPQRITSAHGDERNEAWLQSLIFEHPQMLPVDHFNEAFSPLIPLARELGTVAGAVDCLYVSPRGRLVIVETKLWKNPEGARTVVAQVIDYAKELAGYTLNELDERVRRADKKLNGGSGREIAEIVGPELNRSGSGFDEFAEGLTLCMREGDFLLLIVGDKVKPNLTLMTDAIGAAPGLAFTIGLVEIGLYKTVGGQDWPLLAIPDVVGRTVEKTRGVIQVKYLQEKPDVSVEMADDGTQRSVAGKTDPEQFIARVPEDYRPILEKWLNNWTDPGSDLIVTWGTVGFSVRVRSGSGLVTIFDVYPNREVRLINENHLNYLRGCLGRDLEEARGMYLEALCASPKARNFASLDRAYVRMDEFRPEEVDVIFAASDAFARAAIEK